MNNEQMVKLEKLIEKVVNCEKRASYYGNVDLNLFNEAADDSENARAELKKYLTSLITV